MIELTQRTVDKPAERQYHHIYVVVVLSDTADTAFVTNRFIKVLEQRDLQTTSPKQAPGTSNKISSDIALLKINEIERHTKTVVHYHQYGRTSLTRNHGREVYDKPVITLRATLIDHQSGHIVFQADYVTQGQWYQDSATVVASLAGTLVKQLAHEGFIGPRVR